MVKIEYTKAIIEVFPKYEFRAEQIRGFFGYLMVEDPGFHHHTDKLIYEYPKVQYKVINHKILILGLAEYASKIYEASIRARKLVIGNKEYIVRSVKFETAAFDIKEEANISYKFVTPWIALNRKNYLLFKEMHKIEDKKILLNKILTGNILSFLKGMDIFIKFRLITNINYFKTKKLLADGNEFEGIIGKFQANIALPDYIGLGKSVSKGYGTIIRCKNDFRGN